MMVDNPPKLRPTLHFVERNVANELRAACERGSGRVVIALGHRAVGCGEEILQLAERVGAPVLTRLDATPDVWRGWFWVNYNELTASSLEIIVSKGNHPQMALIQVSELL